MELIYDLRQLQTALQNTSVPMVRVYQSSTVSLLLL